MQRLEDNLLVHQTEGDGNPAAGGAIRGALAAAKTKVRVNSVSRVKVKDLLRRASSAESLVERTAQALDAKETVVRELTEAPELRRGPAWRHGALAGRIGMELVTGAAAGSVAWDYGFERTRPAAEVYFGPVCGLVVAGMASGMVGGILNALASVTILRQGPHVGGLRPLLAAVGVETVEGSTLFGSYGVLRRAAFGRDSVEAELENGAEVSNVRVAVVASLGLLAGVVQAVVGELLRTRGAPGARACIFGGLSSAAAFSALEFAPQLGTAGTD